MLDTIRKILTPLRALVGREPAAVIAAIEALLMFGVSFGFTWLTPEQAALWIAGIAAVGAAATGWATVNTRLSLVVGIFRTLFAVAASYGVVTLSAEQIGLAMALVTAFGGLWLRTQNSPSSTAISEGGREYANGGMVREPGTPRS